MCGAIVVGGGEAYRLYHRDPEGALHPLTPEGTRSQDVLWSPDGSRFAFSSNMQDGVSTDVYVADLSGPDSIQLAMIAIIESQKPIKILAYRLITGHLLYRRRSAGNPHRVCS